MNYDIYLVGVGGQGVLTIGEILSETALRKGLPVNFYPTKGMAQRGGFVKAQLRLGRVGAGPTLPEKGADLVVAMEVSEALKAVRFVRPGGHFVLYGHVWAPTAVMLSKEPYPALADVLARIRGAGAEVRYLDPAGLPTYEGAPVAPNVYILGAAVAQTPLGVLLSADEVAYTVETRWKRGVERNRAALRGGLAAAVDEGGV
ncbi:MAG: 2-oxoacid:acceptor oxidoreductase family protein [Anaerolineae bacterium]|nr:2-oxoacid:acceptor oxidoreductase family protein [Anaerolineae bacterium]